MRKFMSAASIVVFCVVSVFAGTNLIENPDFASGLKGWSSKSKIFQLQKGEKDGESYLKITGSEKLDPWITLTQQLKPNADELKDTSFVLKTDAKVDKLTGKAEVWVSIRQVDEKNKTVIYSAIKLTAKNQGDWKKYELKFKIAEKTVNIQCFIVSRNLAPDDAVQLKDVSLEKVDSEQVI